MKMAQLHIALLSKQAIELIEGLRPLTCNKQYVFYNHSIAKPMSSNALLCVIRTMGYNHTQHLDYRIKMMQEWSDFIDGLRQE